MSVCLVMIVKNESHVIKRCLDSVKEACGDQLTNWVISDTGSTDNTKEVIEKEMAGIPGMLSTDRWVSFGHNRSRVFELAYNRSDWCLLMDADMVLEGKLDLTGLTADALNCNVRSSRLVWRLPLITSNRMLFKYKGAAHEYLTCDETFTTDIYDGVLFDHISDGHSSGDSHRNLELLLAQEEYSARDLFYIGQSYGECGEREKAVESYRKHIEVGDFIEEVFISKYRIGMLNRDIGQLLEAWDYRPSRAEPLYEAVLLLRERNQFRTAVKLGEIGLQIPYPKTDSLFIQQNVYEYDLLYQYSICLDYVDRPKAIRAFHEILGTPGIPDYVRDATRSNLSFARVNL